MTDGEAGKPMFGRLRLVDATIEFRQVFGDVAHDVHRVMLGKSIPADDWRFEVRYGPGDDRSGRVTFHRDATARHVAEYLAREGIELEREVPDV